MNTKKAILSAITAGLLAALSSVPALALSNYTLNGNYIITGDLYVDSLLGHVGQCLEVGTGPLGATEIVATGSACGGAGGVTSVTNTDGNLSIAPTTGAVVANLANNVSVFNSLTVGSGGGTTTLETNTANTGSLTVDGLINAAGNITFAGAGASVPVCTNGSSQLTTTGCTSSGVSSITPGSSGNLTFTPSTGAVVGDISESPAFTGSVLIGTLGSNSSPFTNGILSFGNATGSSTQFFTNPSSIVFGVMGTCLVDALGSPSRGLLAQDCTGDLGILGTFAGPEVAIGSSHSDNTATSGALELGSLSGFTQMYSNSSISLDGVSATLFTIGATGQPTAATMDIAGDLAIAGTFHSASATVAGFPVPQILHGNQSITAVVSACTAGTPITFAHAFSAVPDIVGSTGPIVGDTFAPTSITTSGFTPEVCSVASAATVTVYWSAQN
jgi:hypothetical protein